MCRDGFRAPCDVPNCTGQTRCRDWPRVCDTHWDWYEPIDDDELDGVQPDFE